MLARSVGNRTEIARKGTDMANTKGSRGWGHIRKLPSGRYQASYIHDLFRRTAPMTFTTKPRAEGWLADERKLIELGAWTPPAKRAAARTSLRDHPR